jgi:hypothetical protein
MTIRTDGRRELEDELEAAMLEWQQTSIQAREGSTEARAVVDIARRRVELASLALTRYNANAGESNPY